MVVNTVASNVLNLVGSLWPSLLVPADKINLYYPIGSKLLKLLESTGSMHLQATKPDTIGKSMSHFEIIDIHLEKSLSIRCRSK